MIEVIEKEKQTEFVTEQEEESQTKFPENQEYNEFTRRILSVLKYLESKNAPTRYENIYRCYCNNWSDSHSTETFSRNLRKLAALKIVNRIRTKTRVYFYTNVIVSGQDNFPLIMREE